MPPIDQTLAELHALFVESGADEYYGEPVTQEAHMLQCARLAEQNGADAETVVAAFLHDIGHLLPDELATGGYMDGYGTIDHERLGANFLRQRGFSEKVAQLIENHVNAKRYLTHKNPAYYTNLSEASRQTLQFQGGPMSDDEAHSFENHPNFLPILRVRQWDEAAKISDRQTPAVGYYLEKMPHAPGRAKRACHGVADRPDGLYPGRPRPVIPVSKLPGATGRGRPGVQPSCRV